MREIGPQFTPVRVEPRESVMETSLMVVPTVKGNRFKVVVKSNPTTKPFGKLRFETFDAAHSQLQKVSCIWWQQEKYAGRGWRMIETRVLHPLLIVQLYESTFLQRYRFKMMLVSAPTAGERPVAATIFKYKSKTAAQESALDLYEYCSDKSWLHHCPTTSTPWATPCQEAPNLGASIPTLLTGDQEEHNDITQPRSSETDTSETKKQNEEGLSKQTVLLLKRAVVSLAKYHVKQKEAYFQETALKQWTPHVKPDPRPQPPVLLAPQLLPGQPEEDVSEHNRDGTSAASSSSGSSLNSDDSDDESLTDSSSVSGESEDSSLAREVEFGLPCLPSLLDMGISLEHFGTNPPRHNGKATVRTPWETLHLEEAEEVPIYVLDDLDGGCSPLIPDLLRIVISYLNKRSLLCARGVCKSWNFLACFTQLQPVLWSAYKNKQAWHKREPRDVSRLSSLLPGVAVAGIGTAIGAVTGCVFGVAVGTWMAVAMGKKTQANGVPIPYRPVRIAGGVVLAPLFVSLAALVGTLHCGFQGGRIGYQTTHKGMSKVKGTVVKACRKPGKGFLQWELADGLTHCSLCVPGSQNTASDLFLRV
eukprot:TRINITY_DN66941_c2_g1_i4.p1 TRINITY_DN66941_c2_g1~~TRINITY_DN66941_c2_g1_i4.p1  ORF type:complete len:589 (-),score=20.59 TRINITY_DN66941_c2_g1_i4:579-2345(-)